MSMSGVVGVFLFKPREGKMTIEMLLGFAVTLGGLGSLIAVLVNIGKTVGWVKDGQSATVVTGLNLLLMAAVFGMGVFKPEFDWKGLDENAGQLATVLATVFGFVWQMISSKLAHSGFKGVPVLGKSYSLDQSRVMQAQAAEYVAEQAQRYEG
jgi:hypothetical protein